MTEHPHGELLEQRGPLIELVGVYQADGGLWGEARYLARKLFAGGHCALCDLSHAVVIPRRSFGHAVSRLGVPMRLLHLNERDAALVAFTEGRTPCIVGRDAKGWLMLVEAKMLSKLNGDIGQFEALLAGIIPRLQVRPSRNE